jgi:hypothetical protein
LRHFSLGSAPAAKPLSLLADSGSHFLCISPSQADWRPSWLRWLRRGRHAHGGRAASSLPGSDRFIASLCSLFGCRDRLASEPSVDTCRCCQVVLLDEVEKAHREVTNILLQVFDEGHLTDSQVCRFDARLRRACSCLLLFGCHVVDLNRAGVRLSGQDTLTTDVYQRAQIALMCMIRCAGPQSRLPQHDHHHDEQPRRRPDEHGVRRRAESGHHGWRESNLASLISFPSCICAVPTLSRLMLCCFRRCDRTSRPSSSTASMTSFRSRFVVAMLCLANLTILDSVPLDFC